MRHEKRAKGSALRNASFSRVLFFSPLSLKKKKKERFTGSGKYSTETSSCPSPNFPLHPR